MFQLLGALGPLIPKLTELYEAGKKFHITALARGERSNADRVAATMIELVKDWNPEIEGVRYLDDPETRRAGARFFAGIVVKIVDSRPVGAGARL